MLRMSYIAIRPADNMESDVKMLSVSHVRKWQNEATGQIFAALFSGTARWILPVSRISGDLL